MEDTDKIDLGMQLKLNHSLHTPHLHIHILCPQHWLRKSDENSFKKRIYKDQKYYSIPVQYETFGENEYAGNTV